MPERFLRIRDLSALLGIKPRTFVEYRYRGRLNIPLERKGGMLGCRESVYQQWLEQKGETA